MARKKVKLAFITNDTSRRATFKKRKRGLLKKVSELSTLCGVKACAIVYGPYDRQPDIWPSHPDAHRVLMKFKSLPEMEQSKKMMNQELFLWHRIVKLREQLKKQQRENRYKEITHLMYQSLAGKSLHGVSTDALSDLVWLIGEKGKDIQDRMEELTKQQQQQQEAITVAAIADPNHATGGGRGGGGLMLGQHSFHNNIVTHANNNINGGFNMNMNVGGNHYHHQQQHHQQQVVAGGMNIMNASGVGGGGGQMQMQMQMMRQPQQQVLDPMQAITMENLQRQNWFMDMNPTHHHDPIIGGYAGGRVNIGDDHLQQMLGGMPSSTATYGGAADHNNNMNINNASVAAAAAAAGWMSTNNHFYG